MGIADYQCRQILRDKHRRIAPDFPPNMGIKMDEWRRSRELIHFANAADLGDIPNWLNANGW